MRAENKLSVVMSVYNNAHQLKNSINSILNQSYDDFELILINDGSTDETQQILETFATQDQRIVLFQQPNKGLTSALIQGCKKARGDYIARQDAGDYSYPDRFARQLHYLKSNNDCAVVFSQFRTIDASGNSIHKNHPQQSSLRASIDISADKISAPSHHGSAMFNKCKYIKAGGYRSQFHFAQDLDLWVRMSEIGEIGVIEEILYDALIASNAISGIYHPLQKQFHDIIIESAHLRRRGQSESTALRRAEKIKPTTNPSRLNSNESSTLYFIASCLIKENPVLAKTYLKQALNKNPANVKAWYKLLFKT